MDSSRPFTLSYSHSLFFLSRNPTHNQQLPGRKVKIRNVKEKTWLSRKKANMTIKKGMFFLLASISFIWDSILPEMEDRLWREERKFPTSIFISETPSHFALKGRLYIPKIKAL